MFAAGRLKRVFTGTMFLTGDTTFGHYYGSVTRDQRDCGPSVHEARRDFEQIRHAVRRVETF